MAIAMILEFPGGTQEQFEQVMVNLQLGAEGPAGQLFHVDGPIEGGWRVVDVWESQEAADTFFQEKLGRAMQQAGLTIPHPQVWPVHTMLKP